MYVYSKESTIYQLPLNKFFILLLIKMAGDEEFTKELHFDVYNITLFITDYQVKGYLY